MSSSRITFSFTASVLLDVSSVIGPDALPRFAAFVSSYLMVQCLVLLPHFTPLLNPPFHSLMAVQARSFCRCWCLRLRTTGSQFLFPTGAPFFFSLHFRTFSAIVPPYMLRRFLPLSVPVTEDLFSFYNCLVSPFADSPWPFLLLVITKPKDRPLCD